MDGYSSKQAQRIDAKKSFFRMESPSILLGFFLLMFVAIGVRFLIALQSPNSLSIGPYFLRSDLGVIGLMAKHTLELGEFPFFFWGQNWFGGLESMLHGIAFWLFGISPWAMRLAPLFLFAFFCMLTFLIARDLFNNKVALLALLWCVVAPKYLTALSVVPHTHYLEAPVLGSLCLWLTIRLSQTSSLQVKRFLYFTLGIFGGLGWWANPMVMIYLVSCAIFLLCKERTGGMIRGILFGLPGFFLGALPFFVYYIKDPFSDILGMGQGLEWANFYLGFWRVILLAIPELLDVFKYKVFSSWVPWLVALAYICVIVYFVKSTGRNFIALFSKKAHSTGAQGLLIFFLLVYILIVSTNELTIRIFEFRYGLAFYSFFPVACAYAVWEVGKKWRRLTVPLYGFILFAQGFFIWEWGVKEVPNYENHAQGILKLIDFLKSKGLTRAYTSYYGGSAEMSFMSKENVIFSNPLQERYYPYTLLLDQADAPAFIEGGPGTYPSILKLIGGRCSMDQAGDYYVYHDFEEPERRYRQIDVKGLKASASHKSKEMKKVFDRDLMSGWSSHKPKAERMWVKFDLGKVHQMGMVRLFNRGSLHSNYALDVSVETSLDGIKWNEAIERTTGDYFYWSGPRIYRWEWGYRWEVRLGPVEARYIRIKQYENSTDPWMLTEAYFYEDIGKGPLGREGEREILKAVDQLGLKRVYADRWMSAKLREISNGTIETMDPFTHPTPERYKRFKSRVLKWDPKVGFILEYSDADAFEEMMKKEEIGLTRRDFGRWVLFYFSSFGEKEEELKNDPGWWWMGLGVLEVNHKPKSEFLGDLGKEREGEGKWIEALNYYQRALKHYANHWEARQGLIRVLKQLGREKEMRKEEKILLKQTVPEVFCSVKFERGVEFLGYRIRKLGFHSVEDPGEASQNFYGKVKPGQVLKIIYYWRLHENPGRGIGVFVHVEGQGRLIQGDHKFLERHVGVWPALVGEVFSQEEFIRIPSDAPEGKYSLGLGLFDLGEGKRWKVRRSEVLHKENKVQVGSLDVV